ncbi:MAG: hypothetical protein I4O48_17650 [Ralstonia sp.]|nr:hypothetical protein [Ralstonia sp.]
MPAESDWFKMDADGNYAHDDTDAAWRGWAACATRLEPAVNDASRYVWWCDPSNDIPTYVLYQGKAVIDAFIDGAKKAKH